MAGVCEKVSRWTCGEMRANGTDYGRARSIPGPEIAIKVKMAVQTPN